MKKIILLLITCFLLTGCNATYEVNITKDKIYDTIKITTNSSNITNADKTTTDKFTKQLAEFERGHDYYKRELFTTDKLTGYQYTYDFTYEEYTAMSQLRKCYKDFEMTNDNQITIKTSNQFLCKTYYKDVNNIEITLTSEYKVVSSNADKQKGNQHTWIINSNNYNNKPINITIDKNNTNPDTKKKEENKWSLKMILTFIIFFLLILVLIVRKKDEKKQG